MDASRLLYWAFFKPVTLDNYIKGLNPELGSKSSLLALWRCGGMLRTLAERLVFPIAFVPLTICSGIALPLSILGFAVDWPGLQVAMTVGVMIGLGMGLIGGISAGVTAVVGYGVAFGWLFGLARLPFPLNLFGILLLGLAIGRFLRVGFEIGDSLASGVLIAILTGIVVSTAGDIVLGTLVSAGILLSQTNIALYPFQLLLSLGLAGLARTGNGSRFFRFSPVSWDETIMFPLYGLDSLLITIGRQDRQAVAEPLTIVGYLSHQNWAAEKALIELALNDIEGGRTLKAIASLPDVLAWLPSKMPDALESVLPPVREIAEHIRACLSSEELYNQQQQLRHAFEKMRTLRAEVQLSKDLQNISRLEHTLGIWADMFERELERLGREELIPNVYVSGPALDANSSVFKGRRELFTALTRALNSPAKQHTALLLFGQPRSGKTSAIKQMPVQLGPEVIPVEINLQSAAVSNDAAGLLLFMADQIRRSALLHRNISLKHLTRDMLRSDPYRNFLRWIEVIERQISTRWILLNLDEYETLLDHSTEKGRDERTFQLIRGLIQDHPQIHVLLSGSHTLQDFPPLWSEYLLNVQTIQIGPLAERDARELILEPIPEFALEYDPSAVDHLVEITGCQAYLVQATCRELVDSLNGERRMHASLADVKKALDKTLERCTPYFEDLWRGRDSDDTQRAVMRACAQQREPRLRAEMAPELDQAYRRLKHRDVFKRVNGEYQFQVELVRRWVERNAE